jgi:hypothetical protein
MKKIIRVCLTLVVVAVLVLGFFQLASGGPLDLAGGNNCRVGWNERGGPCLALQFPFKNGELLPLVGWNS